MSVAKHGLSTTTSRKPCSVNRKQQPSNEEALSATTPRASGSHLTATKGTDTMNDMTHSGNSQPTMSSREIAELTGKRHDHVMRDIRSVLDQLEIDHPNFGGVYMDAKGERRECFHLPRRECEILVTGYDVKRRAAVIDRWMKLETEKSTFDPMKALADPATMRNLLLGYSEKVLTLESTVAEQAPKVAALDRLSTAEGSLCLTDAAKHLQVAPKRFIQWLHAHDWIFRRIGSNKWTGYQPRLKQGVLIQKVTIIPLEDGTDKINEQVRVTPKGLSRLAELLREDAA